MKIAAPHIWGFAVVIVAVLNILDVLPDWTTIAAILTLPFASVVAGTRCGRPSTDAKA